MPWKTSIEAANTDNAILFAARSKPILIRELQWSFDDTPTGKPELRIRTGTALTTELYNQFLTTSAPDRAHFNPPIEADNGQQLEVRITAPGIGIRSTLNAKFEDNSPPYAV